MERFKELIFRLSAKLISVQPDLLDGEIKKAIDQVGTYLNMNCVMLSRASNSFTEPMASFFYAVGGSPLKPHQNINENIPWVMGEVLRGETVFLEKIPNDLPTETVKDHDFFNEEDIKSLLALPMKKGSSLLGCCIFFMRNARRGWPKRLIGDLTYLAEILASALERMRAAEQIHELQMTERLLSEISATYINLPTEKFKEVIKNDLGRLGNLLKVDRCLLYWITEDGKQFRWNDELVWANSDEYLSTMPPTEERDWDFFENFRYSFDKWVKNEVVKFESLDELPEEASRLKEIYRRFGLKSSLSVPVFASGLPKGALIISSTRKQRTWTEDLVQKIRLFGEVFANALVRKANEEEIQRGIDHIKKLKEQIEADYLYLTEEIELEHSHGEIVGKSQAMQRILSKVKMVAPTDASVLLLGETGTGKGLIARHIHNASRRCNRPLIQVNCAALSPSLIESEMFGHEKGAFTGAIGRREGRFEQARGTTLFLDEIGELPLELQPKLLRVLQDGEFERVGGKTTIKTDARIIAATNRDLEKDVENGKFRRDLWYRLNVFPIFVPPLRERLDDIPLFVNWFLEKYSKWSGKKFQMIPKKTIKSLRDYSWPGNIRELENLIERAVITCPERQLHIEIPVKSGMVLNQKMTFQEVERSYLLGLLSRTSWVIEGPNGAASQAGLTPSTLRFRMNKLGIKRRAANP